MRISTEEVRRMRREGREGEVKGERREWVTEEGRCAWNRTNDEEGQRSGWMRRESIRVRSNW